MTNLPSIFVPLAGIVFSAIAIAIAYLSHHIQKIKIV